MSKMFIIITLLSAIAVSALSDTNTSCYTDIGNLKSAGTSPFQSLGMCETTCQKAQKAVAAVQGTECYCGDKLPSLDAQVSIKECDTACPGFPNEKCGGSSTWTFLSGSHPEHETGIVTADHSDYASLSVNPTMVQTGSVATGTNPPSSTIPSSILTAPSAEAYPNHPNVASSSLAVSASVSPSASSAASASASSSVTADSGVSSVNAPGFVSLVGIVGLLGAVF
ncbi:hypothetical protein BDV25DRAFT_154309 [Aspergillus avenaceus]|uniref:WSC domain-containing protein n=1 Tax=Aspergillus avenaceus TaxID=36643 RepID=A0A5N6TW36_ASPAV|nr:hypothetical protein BDV25DRAFT_154309 [Aspergillus avenaceus]